MSRSGSLSVLLALLLAACGGGSAPAPATSAPASASATSVSAVKLTASYSNAIASNLPLWVAKEAGIFEQRGLDVELALVESTKGIPALLTGDTRFAHIGGSEVLSASAGGADLVIVGGTVPVWPYVLLVGPDIKKPEDLKGKTLAIAGVGGSYDIAARVALPKIGLVPDKDVTLIATGSVANATAALASGQVAATMSQPPDTLLLESRGFHTLFNLAELKLPTANTTIAATRAYLTANKDVVQRYVDSIVQAIAKEKQDRPLAIRVLKKYLKSEDDRAMNATYDHYVGSVIPSAPYARADQFSDAIATLGKTNEKVRLFDVAKILDESFVRSALERGLDR